MQVQLLTAGEATKQYAVIFYQGDKAFSGLLEFVEKYHVTSAHFTAIGALNGATLGMVRSRAQNVSHQWSAPSDWDEGRCRALSRWNL